MSNKIRLISINFPFKDQGVVCEDTLATERALFDFDVVVIRPQKFGHTASYETYEKLKSLMGAKKVELSRLFAQGGVLAIFLDVADTYTIDTGGYGYGTRYSVNNYEFLDDGFVDCLRSGSGKQISYTDAGEPFVNVLKKSIVAWTAYVASTPRPPLRELKFFAMAGARAAVAGKMPFGEGHLVLLPNLAHLEEALFLNAWAEYRYKRQGTKPPDWVKQVFLPGIAAVESKIASIDNEISKLQAAKQEEQQGLNARSEYKKLLYEKGKTQLEPAARRALDDLELGATPGELITGTNYEIDGRTSKGSVPGIVEVKGSKKQIALDEFSPFVVKILADHEATDVMSKGILVGNGLCEAKPETRLGDTVFSKHVVDGAKRNSVALINSVELYWLCCTLLDGGKVDTNAVREEILSASGYIDLKPFCGESPWR